MKTTVFFILIFLYSGYHSEAQYSFIRNDLNHIILPEDSSGWFTFITKLKAAKEKGKLTILHFGDSHIQADYFTGQVRKDLFAFLETFPKSRGLTMPYRVAGTNGPDELFSKSTGTTGRASVRKNHDSHYFALTGYSISSADTSFSVSLTDTSGYRFNKISVFHNPLKNKQIKVNGTKPYSSLLISDSLTISVFLLKDQEAGLNLTLSGNSGETASLYGFSLENTRNNINYHSVGINGATFGTFLKLHDSGELIRYMDPDCVVLSYGTNDAMPRKPDTAMLRLQIRSAIAVIRSALPDVPVILTTPGDFMIGKKYINPSTALVSELIKKTALENDCACWDFYAVMGGAGSVRDWYRNQLVFKDGIHLSKKGYRLQGNLFFSAILKLKDLEVNE